MTTDSKNSTLVAQTEHAVSVARAWARNDDAAAVSLQDALRRAEAGGVAVFETDLRIVPSAMAGLAQPVYGVRMNVPRLGDLFLGLRHRDDACDVPFAYDLPFACDVEVTGSSVGRIVVPRGGFAEAVRDRAPVPMVAVYGSPHLVFTDDPPPGMKLVYAFLGAPLRRALALTPSVARVEGDTVFRVKGNMGGLSEGYDKSEALLWLN